MNQKIVHVIPAQPGNFIVYQDGNQVFLGEEVIAWRIDTIWAEAISEYRSNCDPITVGGDPGNNCIGIKIPSGKLVSFGDEYDSIEEYIRTQFDPPNVRDHRAGENTP